MKKIFSIFALALVVMAVAFQANAQDKAKAFLAVSYENRNGNTEITAVLTARIDKQLSPVKGVELLFYTENDTSTVEFGKAKTDERGEARFVVPADKVPFKTAESKFLYAVSFDGNDKIKSKSSSVEVYPAKLSFEAKDKNIEVTAEQLGDSAHLLTDEPVAVYVKRLHSWLKVAEGTLSEGAASIEFPATVPGDKDGNLTVMVAVENDNLGKVSQVKQLPWGTKLVDKGTVPEVSGITKGYILFMFVAVIAAFVVAYFTQSIFKKEDL